MVKMSIQYTVLGFEPSDCKSHPINTSTGLPPCQLYFLVQLDYSKISFAVLAIQFAVRKISVP